MSKRTYKRRVVEPGQLYSVLNIDLVRFLVRVLRVVAGRAECEVVGTPRTVSISANTLARGSRGARLVCDGRPIVVRSECEKTASDYRRVEQPKGLLCVSDRTRAIYEMHVTRGIGVAETAAHFGICRSSVVSSCHKYEEAAADARHRGESLEVKR